MNRLNEHFKEVEPKNKNEESNKDNKHKSMSLFFYFMIPFIVLSAMNIYFLYVLIIDFKFIANIPHWFSAVFMLSFFVLSKFLLSGKTQLKEKTLIVAAIHSLFIVACLFSVFLGSFPWYVKVFLATWATMKTKFLCNDLKNIWNSDTKSIKQEKIMI